MIKMNLGQVAALVGGRLSGDATVEITGAATLRDACPGDITLADRPELVSKVAESSAAAVVVPEDVEGVDPPAIPFIAVGDVHAAFATIVRKMRPPRGRPAIGVSPAAHVSPTAQLAADVTVMPGATIGDEVVLGEGVTIHPGVHIHTGCRIGSGTTIYSGAVLYEDTVVGRHVIIHANAVLGAYGFGYETKDGQHHLSAQLGNVTIEDDVEIGAGATIDRGTYGSTLIGRGTKIDNLVMVAHNCRIGRHNIICSQVGIAGSTTTGDYVVMAGQVGLRDHIHIGTKATLGAKAGVMNDVPDDEVYAGIPATPLREQALMQAALAKLPKMRKQLKQLERAVASAAARPQRRLDDAA